MTLREKLGEGLAHWNKEPGKECGNTIEDCKKSGCPYSGIDCVERMLNDTYELLKGMKEPERAKEPDAIPNCLTHEAILKTLLQSITEQCIWDIPTINEEQSAEGMTRVLFHISGLVDMAQKVIKMMEGK